MSPVWRACLLRENARACVPSCACVHATLRCGPPVRACAMQCHAAVEEDAAAEDDADAAAELGEGEAEAPAEAEAEEEEEEDEDE